MQLKLYFFTQSTFDAVRYSKKSDNDRIEELEKKLAYQNKQIQGYKAYINFKNKYNAGSFKTSH